MFKIDILKNYSRKMSGRFGQETSHDVALKLRSVWWH